MESRWPAWLQINDNLKDLTPYGAPQISVAVRLNTNENPYALDQELQNAISREITKQLSHLNRYPDRDALELRSQLATFINQSSGTSFATEIFGRLMGAMRFSKALRWPSRVMRSGLNLLTLCTR